MSSRRRSPEGRLVGDARPLRSDRPGLLLCGALAAVAALLAACPSEEPLPCGAACEPAAGGDGGQAGGGGGGGAGGLGPVAFVTGPTVRAPSATVAVVEFTATRLAAATLTATPAGGSAIRSSPASATSFQVVLGGLTPATEHELTVELRAPGASGISATETLAFTTPAAGAPLRVLFDAAHGEDAGNADWIIDEPGATAPSPADPSGPDDWAGAYSTFGYELYRTGRFELRNNPRGIALDAGTLAGVAVLVLPEANKLLTAAEAAAIWDFVRAGGGVLLLCNHAGSDRDSDGADGADVADALLAAAPELGIRAVKNDIEREDPTTALGEHLLLHGPFAPVRALSFFDATELTVELPAVELARRAHTEAGVGILAAATTLGAGRVVVVGDSAGADDGVGHPGNTLFNGWNDYDNGEFYLNCISWLGNEL